MKSMLDQIGIWLRRKRIEKKLSLEDVANSIYISARQLSRIEQGKQQPSSQILLALAEELELTTDEIEFLFYLQLDAQPDIDHNVSVHAQRRMDALAPNRAAILDWNWNILYGNEPYLTEFTGIAEDKNVLLWLLFNPEAHNVMVNWKEETELTILWWKHNLARYGQNQESSRVYDLCNTSDFFKKTWDTVNIQGARPKEMMLTQHNNQLTKINTELYTSPLHRGLTYFLGVTE